MRHLRAAALLLSFVVATGGCGPAPGEAKAPKGTLVVVIKTGEEKVPFEPSLERVRAAKAQLESFMGHRIEIEIDGALLPQGRSSADEVVANVVETLAKDLDALNRNPKAFAFAKEKVARVVVRYAPGVAAERGRRTTILDAKTKTIDVVRATADWRALDRGEVASAILLAYGGEEDSAYANVMPDQLPRSEWRGWFAYHTRGRRKASADPYEGLSGLSPFAVRGMLRLAALAKDEPLATEVRVWLVKEADRFAGAYHHEATKIAQAPPGSSFRVAEAEYMRWLATELPRMSLEERAEIARAVFVFDFATPQNALDRFSKTAFPGIDRHAIYFGAVDSWIRDGHPPKDERTNLPALYGQLVCAFVEHVSNGERRRINVGRCDHLYYRWALADPAREAVLVKGIVERKDPELAKVFFVASRSVLQDEPGRLRVLRAFEGTPALWKVGADELVADGGRPSDAALDEGRRLWRTSASARPTVLRWFARHMENARDGKAWPDLLQGTLADENVLRAYLDDGAESYRLLPAAWPALAKSGRARAVLAKTPAVLDAKSPVRPGDRSTAATLVELARLLSGERAAGEVAEIHTFAKNELPKRPGDGMSEVIEATKPETCDKQRPRPRPALSDAFKGRQ